MAIESKAITRNGNDKMPSSASGLAGGHTLSMYVNNQPGVLMRICQVFARRAYNIDSLVVSEGRDKRFSRLTLGISGDPAGLEQIIKQCNKLVDVIHCFEHTPADAVVRELLLVKLRTANVEQRTEVLQIVEHFGGKTVDLSGKSLIARFEGATDKVDAAIRLLSVYDIIETVRTGKVVMARGEQPT